MIFLKNVVWTLEASTWRMLNTGPIRRCSTVALTWGPPATRCDSSWNRCAIPTRASTSVASTLRNRRPATRELTSPSSVSRFSFQTVSTVSLAKRRRFDRRRATCLSFKRFEVETNGRRLKVSRQTTMCHAALARFLGIGPQNQETRAFR